jgi:hypothetical protein
MLTSAERPFQLRFAAVNIYTKGPRCLCRVLDHVTGNARYFGLRMETQFIQLTVPGQINASLTSFSRTIDEYNKLAKQELVPEKQTKAYDRVKNFRTELSDYRDQFERLRKENDERVRPPEPHSSTPLPPRLFLPRPENKS